MSSKSSKESFKAPFTPCPPPSRCANVVVIRFGQKTYQGVCIGHAKDREGIVRYVLVDENSMWRSPDWVHVYDVYEVE